MQFTADGSVTRQGFHAGLSCCGGGGGGGCAVSDSYDAAVASSNVAIDTNHAGHFGSGFRDYQGASDQYITFVVPVAVFGDCQMQVGYALGATDRPLRLEVNGMQTVLPGDGLLHFPPSSSWTDWRLTDPVTVALTAGSNTITLRSVGSSGGNIDGIHIQCGGDGGAPAPAGEAAKSRHHNCRAL